MSDLLKRKKFVESVADYIETHHDYENLTKRDVAIEVANILVNDIGAAQNFLDAIGLNVDLYECDFDNNTKIINEIKRIGRHRHIVTERMFCGVPVALCSICSKVTVNPRWPFWKWENR